MPSYGIRKWIHNQWQGYKSEMRIGNAISLKCWCSVFPFSSLFSWTVILHVRFSLCLLIKLSTIIASNHRVEVKTHFKVFHHGNSSMMNSCGSNQTVMKNLIICVFVLFAFLPSFIFFPRTVSLLTVDMAW